MQSENDQELNYLKESMLGRLIQLEPFFVDHVHLLPTLRALHHALEKASTHEQVRELYGVAASLLASIDWQSPSFLHATKSQAGAQEGKIVGTINDYKRDQHLDAAAFEAAFAKAYIDAPLRIGPSVYATSSGMAAFTTILAFLQYEHKADGPILAGKNCYFENKGLLKKAFPNRTHFIDEMDTPAVLAAVEKHQPSVIFFDTLCNTETIAVPQLGKLMPQLVKRVRHHMYVVLDNSGMGPMYQPMRDFPRLSRKLHLLVFESLNKFYQFGMDRVTGGVIWGVGSDTLGIMSMRTHLGTNIPDASVQALPKPNRAILEARMRRIDRNALLIAETLDAHIQSNPRSALSHITYPGLHTFPGYVWTHTAPFHGAFLVLNFKKSNRIVGRANHFLKIAIEEAKQKNVPLVAGTSFGLNVTRVYLTALKAQKDARPFLRISVGTESMDDVQKLIDVFKHAIDRL